MAPTALRDAPAPPPVPPVTTALRRFADRCLAALPQTTGCAVSLTSSDGRRLTTESTDEVAGRISALYDAHAQNPCVTAWSSDAAVRVQPDGDMRWPLWWAAVRDLGARSVLVAPLRTTGRRLGTCLLYSTERHAYRDVDELTLSALACQAAASVDRAQGPLRPAPAVR
jgi:GAF domain-containing protein